MESGPVLILLALLGALVVAIGLKSFLRWLSSCRGRDEVDLSDDFSLRMAKSDLKALPIIVYSAASKPTPVPTDCPICLAEFADGEKVRVLPNCNHRFHLECIDAWLVSHSSCPLCRHSLILHKEKAWNRWNCSRDRAKQQHGNSHRGQGFNSSSRTGFFRHWIVPRSPQATVSGWISPVQGLRWTAYRWTPVRSGGQGCATFSSCILVVMYKSIRDGRWGAWQPSFPTIDQLKIV